MKKLILAAIMLGAIGLISLPNAAEADTPGCTTSFILSSDDGVYTTYNTSAFTRVIMPNGSPWSCFANAVSTVDSSYAAGFNCYFLPEQYIAVAVVAFCSPFKTNSDHARAFVADKNKNTTTLTASCQTTCKVK